MLLWTAFLSFIKIGLFTIGGGYAMIPLVEREVVTRRQWLTPEEFLDSLTLAQTVPGLLAVNMAIFVGYKLKGAWGALVTAIAAILPSFVIILIIAIFFGNYKDNEIVERIFKGIRPAVVALLVVPVINLCKQIKLSWKQAWIPVLAVLIIVLGGSAVLVIMSAIILSLLYSYYKARKETKQ